jgi:hypothetical protein
MKNLFYLIAFIPTLLFAQIIQDPCTLSPDPGPCNAAVPKYYFNQETQQCTMFSWGGCAGIVPFNTLNECESASCTTTTVDSCIAVPIDGCFSISLWNPVCGCDGVTYSNNMDAACNTIFDFTMGVCGSTNDILGCTDDSAVNYNPLATLEDGSCIYFEIPGCMDEDAINYNPIATIDDDSCIYFELIFGCTDIEACNYNSEATVSDSSCEYAEQYYDCIGSCLNDSDEDTVCDELDNCLLISNPNQLDTDNDGDGDDCDYDDHISLEEINNREIPLIKMIDVLGREYKTHPKGKLLFYIYLDSSVQKKFVY